MGDNEEESWEKKQGSTRPHVGERSAKLWNERSLITNTIQPNRRGRQECGDWKDLNF